MSLSISRRRFLRRTAATAGAAALGSPAVARAQGPVVLRCQSTWAEKTLFHEYAADFVRKVNDMAGGDLRIDLLPAGAVAAASGLLDSVNKGTLDGGHGMFIHHYAKHHALALWGSGPAFGMDANLLLAWHKYGGGRQLLAKLYAAIGADVVSFPYGPMPTQPLGWFHKPIGSVADFKGLAFRTDGMAIDVFTGLGAVVNALPARDIAGAMQRGLLQGAEFNNASADRMLGLPEVAKVCMLQSYHQSAEQFEIVFNKTKFEALPPKLKAIIENAVEAASADMAWKAIDRYSRDHQELRGAGKVRMLKTPDAVLARQLEAYDAAAAKRRNNALFREIEDSQRRFAERAVRWQLDTQVGPRIAFNHYFARQPAARKK